MPRIPLSIFLLFAVLIYPLAPACAATREEPGMVLVPAGPFIMGSNRSDDSKRAQEYGLSKPWYEDEHPQRRLTLPAFWLDQYEVTNAQYREFIRQANYYVPQHWKENGYLLTPPILNQADEPILRQLAEDVFKLDLALEGLDKQALITAIGQQQAQLDNLPVNKVTWHNAYDYCQWAGKRLPTEAEWEKAARGGRGQEYPWGDEWRPGYLNAGDERWPLGLAPVGSYPQGKSPYGAYDLAGNVMEWVQDWYQAYPGNPRDHESYGTHYKVARGGGWGGVGHYILSHFYRGAYRANLRPEATYADIGFRCAKDVSALKK